MAIVEKISIQNSSSAPISETLFGRCSTAAATQDKVIEVINNPFNASSFEEGFSLRVFFENGNTAKDPRLKISIGNSYSIVNVVSFAMYQGGNHNWEPAASDYHDYGTCTWKDGGVVSFTFMKNPDRFIIDNQALDTKNTYGYQVNSNEYFIDWAYGTYDASKQLQTCGYENPNIKNGYYIYAMTKSGDQPVKTPSSTNITEGILKVIRTTNYVIQEWVFHTEPGNVYRRIWANNTWSSWKNIVGVVLP